MDVVVVELEDRVALVPVSFDRVLVRATTGRWETVGGYYSLLDVPGNFTEFCVVVTILVEGIFLPFLEKFGTHAVDGCDGLCGTVFRVICDDDIGLGRLGIWICRCS